MKDAKLPLFITGHPRSGTTMLRLIFNSHSQLVIPDETGLLHWFYKRPWFKKFTRSKIPIPSPKAQAFGEEIIQKFNALPWSDRTNPKTAISYLYEQLAKENNKPFWGDKTPLHTQFADEIMQLYPNAFILEIVRDPRAVAGSAKRHVKNKRKGTDFWITDNLNQTISRWKWEFELTKKFLNKYPENMQQIVYEELVANPEQHLKSVCSSIGLPFEQQMLNFHQKQSNQQMAWHKETTKPINQENVEKWRKDLTQEEIETIEKELEPEMRQLGYLGHE